MPLLQLLNYIDGRPVASRSTARTEVVDPATGEAYASAPDSGEADVDAAMTAALAAFNSFKRTTPSQRQGFLLKIASAIEAHADELARLECKNCGKPFLLTLDEEIAAAVDQIRFFAGAARQLEGRAAGEYMEGLLSMIVREPVGVCAAVTPWNYPLMMAVWKWAPALAAGNTVVLKPSDTTPVSTLRMAELMGAILPSGVFNVVCGRRETGRLLVEHAVPSLVSITGSVRAGREVAASAVPPPLKRGCTSRHDTSTTRPRCVPQAPLLKRVHLELGGKVCYAPQIPPPRPPRPSRPSSSPSSLR